MNFYRISVTTQQRISLGVGGERAYLTRTHPYIPGGVIRGALAGAWLAAGTYAPTDPEFVHLFAVTRFSPLFPPGVTVKPQSVTTCKYHHRDATHRAYLDRAFESATPADAESRSECGTQELKGDFTALPVVTKISTAIRPDTGTALDSNLFARETIETGHVFAGSLTSEMEFEELTDMPVRLGGRRSILGAGRVTIEKCAPPTVPGLRERVVLRTVSPTFLVDEYARPTSDLASVLTAQGLHPERVWAHRTVTESTGGWHLASGLPKPCEVALAPGAVVALTVADEQMRQAVNQLLETGLGLRRTEGFGWVELVEKAWEPPTGAEISPPEQEPEAAAPEPTWIKQISSLELTREQHIWLMNLLLDVRAADDQIINQALSQPAGKRLSDHQRSQVTRLLTDIPAAERAGIRRELRRTAPAQGAQR